jgi:pimeloyl-ACP methyl ester carboxylesterase
MFYQAAAQERHAVIARRRRREPNDRIDPVAPAKMLGNTASDSKGWHMLEVIDKGSSSESHPVPLLFVHGAWHAAWCWDEHFLDFFADKGYRAVALSLRNHGNSPAVKRMRTCSLAKLIDDVVSVADKLPSPPILIGHSLGGLIVQKYLECHEAPAGVLLASLSSRGAGGFFVREAKRHPLSFIRSTITGKTLHSLRTPERAREHFYSAGVPESDVVRYSAAMSEEYGGRLTLDTSLLNLPKPDGVTTPLLVLGAELDACVTATEAEMTARAYGTEAQIFPSMGHNMMLEPGWQAVAERIASWLETQGL